MSGRLGPATLSGGGVDSGQGLDVLVHPADGGTGAAGVSELGVAPSGLLKVRIVARCERSDGPGRLAQPCHA